MIKIITRRRWPQTRAGGVFINIKSNAVKKK